MQYRVSRIMIRNNETCIVDYMLSTMLVLSVIFFSRNINFLFALFFIKSKLYYDIVLDTDLLSS